MAFPTTSAIFRQFVNDVISNTQAYDLSGTGVDTFMGQLMNNNVSGTKDDSAPAKNSTGWTTATEEVSDTGGWAAGGRAIDSPAVTNAASGTVMWDVADEVSGTITTGLSNVYGWFIYDDTLTSPTADPAVCFNYFGGSNSASAGGTLTVVIAANGVFRFTV